MEMEYLDMDNKSGIYWIWINEIFRKQNIEIIVMEFIELV